MLRAIIYNINPAGEEVIIYKTEWMVNVEECFRATPFHARDSRRYYRRIESRYGTSEYYYQLFDLDGCVVTRSDNYCNAERCLSAAELESQQSGYHYSIEKLLTTNSHTLYAEAVTLIWTLNNYQQNRQTITI